MPREPDSSIVLCITHPDSYGGARDVLSHANDPFRCYLESVSTSKDNSEVHRVTVRKVIEMSKRIFEDFYGEKILRHVGLVVRISATGALKLVLRI